MTYNKMLHSSQRLPNNLTNKFLSRRAQITKKKLHFKASEVIYVLTDIRSEIVSIIYLENTAKKNCFGKAKNTNTNSSEHRT